jgi:hypothetical protein
MRRMRQWEKEQERQQFQSVEKHLMPRAHVPSWIRLMLESYSGLPECRSPGTERFRDRRSGRGRQEAVAAFLRWSRLTQVEKQERPQLLENKEKIMALQAGDPVYNR